MPDEPPFEVEMRMALPLKKRDPMDDELIAIAKEMLLGLEMGYEIGYESANHQELKRVMLNHGYVTQEEIDEAKDNEV